MGLAMKSILFATVAFVGLTTGAMAADAVAQLPVASTYNWSGAYIGGQIGYGWGRDHIKDENRAFGGSDYSDSFSLHGVTGGVFGGYNWQSNNIVYGVEGDIEASGIVGHNSDWPFGTDDHTRIRAQGSLRARLGYAVDNWMPYLTGGLAFGDIKTKFQDGAATDSKSQVKTGWTIGAGVDYAINANWIAQIEYRYADFGKITTNTNTTDPGWQEHERLRTNTVRVGFSYKFN